MLINATQENLFFFEALASPVRLRIIGILSKQDCNIKELSEKVGVSSPIMLKHVKKLEDAGIIRTTLVNKNGAIHKICTALFTEYILAFPERYMNVNQFYEVDIPVGHFTDIVANPTCGLVNETGVIGKHLDNPAFFLEPGRMDAQLIWFCTGYVEYKFPNYLTKDKKPKEIEMSFEIASEAPSFNDDWPSDIEFSINGVSVGKWICPGDFGKKRGLLTPAWWAANQYGVLKMLRITDTGTFLDSAKLSEKTLDDLNLNSSPFIALRFSTKASDENPGGISLFGEKFGNYSQNINVRVFYSED